MASNRFAHLIPPAGGVAAPQARQNRFAALIPKKGTPSDGPQRSNEAEKGSLPMSLAAHAADMAKSGGTGLVEGTVGLLTLPQTVGGAAADLVTRGINAVRGLPSEQTDAQLAAAHEASKIGFLTPPTQEGMQAAVNQVIPAYEPKSQAGDYARTVGSFIPAAAQGPGGIGRKLIAATTSGLASEAAGKATEGTAYEPIARAGAAVLGGAAVAPSARSTVKTMAAKAPTQGAVKVAADNLYGRLRDAGIQYDALSFDRMARYLSGKLGSDGFRAAQAPRSADVVQMIAERVGQGVDFNDLESIRKSVGSILREGPAVSATDKAAAASIMETLDSYAARAPVSTNGKIAAAHVQPMVKEARELARRNIIARDIEDMFAKAETYQSGATSGLRNQFGNYLRSKRGKTLTQQERAAFFEVAKGTPTQNVMNTIGRLGVDVSKLGNIATLLPAAAAGGTYAYTGDPVLAASVAALGTGAKLAGRKMVTSSANRAKNVVLAGRGAQEAVAKEIAAQRAKSVLQGLVAAETGLTSQTRQAPPQSSLLRLLGASR